MFICYSGQSPHHLVTINGHTHKDFRITLGVIRCVGYKVISTDHIRISCIFLFLDLILSCSRELAQFDYSFPMSLNFILFHVQNGLLSYVIQHYFKQNLINLANPMAVSEQSKYVTCQITLPRSQFQQ